MSKEFPYTAWRLTPSFKVEQVEIVGPYTGHRSWFRHYKADIKGRNHAPCELFATKAEAIGTGRRQLAGKEAKLAKMRANLDKKIAALDKAEAQA